jgi:hypothetical protein
VLPPPPFGHPPIAITPDKVEIYPKKRGGQGEPPLTPLLCKVFNQPPCPARVRRGARATPEGGKCSQNSETSFVNRWFELNFKKLVTIQMSSDEQTGRSKY